MDANGLFDAVAESIADFQILRSKPAANMLGLQILVQSLGKLRISAGVTDKTRRELNEVSSKGTDKRHEIFGYASIAKESLRDFTFGAINGIDSDCGWAEVVHRFEPFDPAQVECGEYRPPNMSFCEIRPDQLR